MNPFPINRSLLWSSWLLVCVFIGLLSLYGRPLQYWVADSIGYTLAAWIIGLSLLTIICLFSYSLYRFKLQLPWFHFIWFLPLFLILPLLLERVEERLHFLTFGAFGAISILLFNPRLAFIVCISGAAGDELFQFYLPDRVGDWRDVAMNCLASLGAGYFIYSTVKVNSER